MKIFNAILGIFAVFASIHILAFPGLSFLKAGWIITILLCVRGACTLFEVLSKKADGPDGKQKTGRAILALLGGVAAAFVSFLAVFYPGLSLVFDIIAVVIFTVWLIISGTSSILSAVTVIKPTGNSLWIVSLILGILTLLAGVYGIFHLILMMQTMGVMIGVLLMLYGVRLIASLFEYSK